MAEDLREEMDAHFEMELEDRRAPGTSDQEAHAAASRHFGRPIMIGERAMDEWGFGFWDVFLQDLRYAVRTLRRTKAFTIVALLSLGVGIGAGTAIFSLINAQLWKKLRVSDPDRLVLVWSRDQSPDRPTYAFLYPMFQRFQERSSVFSGVASSWLIDRSNVILDSQGTATGPLRAGLVSGNYFTTLGVKAALGRALTPDDDRPNAAGSVVVISHEFWGRKLQSASDVIGRTLRLNQTIFTIVGVAERDFRGDWVGSSADLWFPFAMEPQISPDARALTRFPTRAFARLKPGVTIGEAQAASTVLYQQLMAEDFAQPGQQTSRLRIELQPAGGGYAPQREALHTPIAILSVLAALILFAGCGNVANLLVARATFRQREMAVRAAIGAGQLRIARQVVTETLLLAFAGGLIGLLLASASTKALSALMGPGPASHRSSDVASSVVALAPSVGGDFRVFGFAALICVIAGIGFGVAQALRFSRASLASSLADRNAAVGGTAARKALVIVQVALSMVLVCGASLFLSTLDNLKKQDLGFDRDHLLMAWVEASQTGRSVPELARLADTVRRQMASIPGAFASGLAFDGLLSGRMWGVGSETFRIQGLPPKPGLLVAGTAVAPGFFAAAGTPILAGHDFSEHDTLDTPRVAIINETMARFYFGNENPIGKRMGAGNDVGYPVEIIGVVTDAKIGTARDRRGMRYSSFRQSPANLMGPWCVVVRTAGDPLAVAAAVRDRLRAIDPAMPVSTIDTVADQLDGVLTQERLVSVLSVSFALIATWLACIGLYGVMAYATVRRTREFGIRMALGATAGGMRAMVLRSSFLMTLAGIAAGIPLTIAGARAASGMLFGVGSTDWRVLTFAGVLLMMVAGAAGSIPAHRASRIHPSDALRHD
jgi:predicted permease